MAWIPIAAAAVSAAGSFLGGRQQASAQSEYLDRSNDFSERMSSTAHQREVADLRAAGLNPILSSRLGGASSPTGALGTAQNYIGEASRSGVNSAISSATLDANLENLRQQNEKLKADTELSKSQNVLTGAQLNKTENESAESASRTANNMVENQILQEDVHSARSAGEKAKIDEDLIKDSPILRRLGTIFRELGLTGNSLSRIRR